MVSKILLAIESDILKTIYIQGQQIVILFQGFNTKIVEKGL